jgi:hypothetical protein
LDLAGVEIGRLHYRCDHAVHGGNGAWGISARGARRACCGDRSLLRRLLDGGINIEGPSEPNDAQQKHEHQRQHERGLGDLRPVSASESVCDGFDVQQAANSSLRGMTIH